MASDDPKIGPPSAPARYETSIYQPPRAVPRRCSRIASPPHHKSPIGRLLPPKPVVCCSPTSPPKPGRTRARHTIAEGPMIRPHTGSQGTGRAGHRTALARDGDRPLARPRQVLILDTPARISHRHDGGQSRCLARVRAEAHQLLADNHPWQRLTHRFLLVDFILFLLGDILSAAGHIMPHLPRSLMIPPSGGIIPQPMTSVRARAPARCVARCGNCSDAWPGSSSRG
jgi:hypothetical protein